MDTVSSFGKFVHYQNEIVLNNSERPVDALAVKKYQSPTDNLKSRDASASKNWVDKVGEFE